MTAEPGSDRAHRKRWRPVFGRADPWCSRAAVVGGLIYALAGGAMAAGNLGSFGWSRNANPLFVWLGLGLGLVVLGFAVAHGSDIWNQGAAGRVAAVAALAATLMLLASPLIEFAIFGTFATFIAFVAFTIAVRRARFLPAVDVALLCAATVASITWNTETASAALLIVVGIVMAWISYRALVARRWVPRIPRDE